jgi:hypothetical protein
LKAHLRAWGHAYVLAKLVSGISFPSGKTDLQILEKEAGEVMQALKIVNMAFEQGVGIERGLMAKGWDVDRSMMCPHLEGGIDWGSSRSEEKTEDMEKRE